MEEKNNKNHKKMWCAFVLKDRFSSDFEKGRLKNDLCGEFGFSDDDIRYVSDSDDMFSGLFYYFFVREKKPNADLAKIYEFRKSYFEGYDCHSRITEQEFLEMTRDISCCNSGSIKFGDIVRIKNGKYCRLNGIVLRTDRNGDYEVGLKFCFGTVIESYKSSDLKVFGNIFNYIKVLK